MPLNSSTAKRDMATITLRKLFTRLVMRQRLRAHRLGEQSATQIAAELSPQLIQRLLGCVHGKRVRSYMASVAGVAAVRRVRDVRQEMLQTDASDWQQKLRSELRVSLAHIVDAANAPSRGRKRAIAKPTHVNRVVRKPVAYGAVGSATTSTATMVPAETANESAKPTTAPSRPPARPPPSKPSQPPQPPQPQSPDERPIRPLPAAVDDESVVDAPAQPRPFLQRRRPRLPTVVQKVDWSNVAPRINQGGGAHETEQPAPRVVKPLPPMKKIDLSRVRSKIDNSAPQSRRSTARSMEAPQSAHLHYEARPLPTVDVSQPQPHAVPHAVVPSLSIVPSSIAAPVSTASSARFVAPRPKQLLYSPELQQMQAELSQLNLGHENAGVVVTDSAMFRADDSSHIPQLVPQSHFFTRTASGAYAQILAQLNADYAGPARASGQISFVRVIEATDEPVEEW